MRYTPAIWRFVCFLGLLLYSHDAQSQQRNRVLTTVDTLVYVDSGYVIPATVSMVCGDSVLKEGKDYRWQKNHQFLVLAGSWRNKPIQISYQAVSPTFFRLRQMYPMRTEVNPSGLQLENKPPETAVTETSGLLTDGVLLRGLSFGNAQDLVPNSALNLRMSGKINNNLSIEGALTDQEYPFQPEGTSSSIQDFDRIYVKAQTAKSSVTLGDYAFSGLPQAWFSKYAKKNRGIQLQRADTIGSWQIRSEGNAALARGRFARNELQGQEGLQGPYRLTGARNENFIIIVSGTEVVYLDGKRLERGYQADYTIDYNLGEITFTPKHLIAQNSRIVVEFQYTDRFYTRMVGAALVSAEKRNVTLFASMFREGDLPSQPLQQDLSLFDSSRMLDARQIMELAGDNPSAATMNGAFRQSAFNPAAPNYIKKDSAGFSFFAYKSAPDSGEIYYRLSFAYVGPGRGNYRLSATTANGKTYRFVPPSGTLPQGDYEPIQVLHTPNKNSLSEWGMIWKFRPGNQVKISNAFSLQDNNLFSPLDDADNRGRALGVEWKQHNRIGKSKKDTTRSWQLQNDVKSEWTSARFTAVERFRDVEFGRLWNRQLFNPEGGATPAGSRYITHRLFLGNRHLETENRWGVNRFGSNLSRFVFMRLKAEKKGWFAEPAAEVSKATLGGLNNDFKQLRLQGGYRQRSFAAVLEQLREESVFRMDTVAGSLMNNSYRFDESRLRMDVRKGKYTLSFNAAGRTNLLPQNSSLIRASRWQSAGTDFFVNGKKAAFLKTGWQYRSMQLLDSAFAGQFADEKHTSARVEWSFPALTKNLSGNIFYQTLSAREQQRQFAYFEVPAGQGYYTWIDFNENKVQEVSEFVETPFRDQARFVRLLLPTGAFIRAQSVEWNGSLHYRLKNKRETVFFSNRLGWNYLGRNTFSSSFNRYLPFTENLQSDAIIAANALLRNQAEIEGARWSVQYTTLFRGNKNFFGQGPELRNVQTHTLFHRRDLGTAWQLRATADKKLHKNQSAVQPANNFAYSGLSAEPQILWQLNTRMRIAVSGKKEWSDSIGGKRLADRSEISATVTRSIGSTGMLDLRFTRIDFTYNAQPNTALAFDVMQGFTPGKNYRFNAEIRMSAANNVQILLNYEARKTANVGIIHIGRAEARYLF